MASPAHATSVIYVSAPEQAAMSTAIVEAVVGAKDLIAYPDGRVYTDTTLQIVRTINGDAPAVVNVRQTGGEHNGQKIFIAGDGRLTTGDRVVAILHQVGNRWYLTALALSVWHIEGAGPDALVVRDTHELAMHQDTLSGSKLLATSPLEYTTLGQLRDELSTVSMEGEP